MSSQSSLNQCVLLGSGLRFVWDTGHLQKRDLGTVQTVNHKSKFDNNKIL